jgi:dTDP-4-amino-4,6-dideoxygalactose transaminase
LGYNFRLDDIRASIAIEQLKKLPHDLKMRIKVRNYYLEGLSKIKGVIVPFADSFEFVSNYIMPIVLENSTKEKRDQVREIIHEAGIQTSIHYPAVHRFAIYRDCESELPQTNYVTDNEITLPMYATLTNEQIDFILETVDRAING